MYVNYDPLEREIDDVIKRESINYQIKDRQIFIQLEMFPSSLEVELFGKDPDSMTTISELWSFKGLSDGILDISTLTTSFNPIPVVEAFIANDVLHLVLLQTDLEEEFLNVWIDVEDYADIETTNYDEISFDWVSRDNIIDSEKESKKQELSSKCQSSILDGFEFTLNGQKYHHSYDREAQTNLQERWLALENGLMDEIVITVHQDDVSVRLKVDKEDFKVIYLESIKSKEEKISRLRDVLFPLVDEITDLDDMVEIDW